MADSLFIVPIQIWVYSMVYTLAVRLWLGARALLLAGLLIQAVTDWLVTELFGPAISDFALLSQGLLPAFFTVAVFLLAMGYLLAPFARIRVVNPGKALGWLLFALLFYQAGPGLYVEGEALRRALSAEFYGAVLAQASSAPTATGPIAVLNSIAAGPDEAMGALDNQFGAFIPSDLYVDGLDLAMAYTLSTGEEVVFATDDLPQDFAAAYFDPLQGPLFYLAMTPEARSESINAGLAGLSRLLLAGIVIGFGLFEQAIYLSLSLAAGILFVSMSVALLFAFFERTELIARSLLDMWLELFILSLIIAVLQALVVGLVTLGARSLNPSLTLGAACIGDIVMAVLLFKALGAIWEALNRMFSAMSQTVGGGLPSPAEAGLAAAGAGAGLALSVATAGAGAGIALGAGAGLAQVAGSALSGMDALYSASAMGSFILPEGSGLKATAQGFYEGALSNRMLGPLGGLLLRGEEAASPSMATPTRASAAEPVTAPVPEALRPATPAASPAEVDLRFDSADLSGLREAVATAMRQALAAAPASGYLDLEQAGAALRTALATVPLAGSPTGFAADDLRLREYVDQRAEPLASHLMLGSITRVPVDMELALTPTMQTPPVVELPEIDLSREEA